MSSRLRVGPTFSDDSGSQPLHRFKFVDMKSSMGVPDRATVIDYVVNADNRFVTVLIEYHNSSKFILLHMRNPSHATSKLKSVRCSLRL